MEDDKNPMRDGVAGGLNNFVSIFPSKKNNRYNKSKKNNRYNKIFNNFKKLLEDDSSIEIIKNDNELNIKIYEIYGIIKQKYINE